MENEISFLPGRGRGGVEFINCRWLITLVVSSIKAALKCGN